MWEKVGDKKKKKQTKQSVCSHEGVGWGGVFVCVWLWGLILSHMGAIS